MKNLSLSVLFGLIALLAMPLGVQAADVEADAGQQAEWQARLDKAAALQARSKAMQTEADAALELKERECATRFFVNSCLKDAEQAHTAAGHAAKRLEIEGKALEREVKREQVAAREQQRAEEAPQQAAELQAREAATAEAREAAVAKEAATRADKAARATVGEKRKAADAEKYRQKQEAHDARVAAKQREAEQRAAAAAAKPQSPGK